MSQHKLILYLFFSSILFFGKQALSQNRQINPLDSLSGKLVLAVRENAREKVVLETNKQLYTPGGKIWFRAFLLNDMTNRISTRSKILHVDLVDAGDRNITRVLLNSGQQQTAGSLAIPDSLPAGYYWIRAFTRQMAASDSLMAAVKCIYIANAKNPNPAREMNPVPGESRNKPVINIFPEGGSLMTGTESRVGIYVRDEEGFPLAITGYLKNDKDNETIPCVMDAWGFGSFSFVPSRFRNYTFSVKWNGKDIEYPLPGFDMNAGQVSVRKSSDDMLILRTVLEDSLSQRNSTSYVIGMVGDSMFYAGVGHGSYETSVPVNNLRPGMVSFLLFNYKLELISERIVYIKGSPAKLEVQTGTAAYGKRQKAGMTAGITDPSGRPLSATLHINVTDSNLLAGRDALDRAEFQRRLIHGEIDEWILMRLNGLSADELDRLMLCHPPVYKGLLANSQVGVVPVTDSSLYISGRLFNKKGTPAGQMPVTLFSSEINGEILADTTDPEGRFCFPTGNLSDSTKFYFQAGTEKGQIGKFNVVLDPASSPKFRTPTSLKIPYEVLQRTFNRVSYSMYADEAAGGNIMMKPVVVEAQAKKPLGYDESKRVSANSFVLTHETLEKVGSGYLGNALRMIPGLQVLNGYVTFYGLNSMNSPNAGSEPMVLVEGVEATLPSTSYVEVSPVLQYFNQLNVQEVDFIEVFRGPEASMFGVRGGNGAIYIHTANSSTNSLKADKSGVYSFYSKGYAKESEFPYVNYKDPEFREMRSDPRSTLLWDGNVLNDGSGKLSRPFYTGDRTGLYQVIVSGVTLHGDLLYYTSVIRVR